MTTLEESETMTAEEARVAALLAAAQHELEQYAAEPDDRAPLGAGYDGAGVLEHEP